MYISQTDGQLQSFIGYNGGSKIFLYRRIQWHNKGRTFLISWIILFWYRGSHRHFLEVTLNFYDFIYFIHFGKLLRKRFRLQNKIFWKKCKLIELTVAASVGKPQVAKVQVHVMTQVMINRKHSSFPSTNRNIIIQFQSSRQRTFVLYFCELLIVQGIAVKIGCYLLIFP